MPRPPQNPKTPKENRTEQKNIFLFESAEEAWFWFIQAQQARNEGARFTAGLSLMPRPCEPTDIMKILDKLYRNRRLMRDHLLVLRHYGRRQMAPDPRRVKEAIAHKLWTQAMERIEPVLVRKEIVRERSVMAKLVDTHSEKLTTPYPNKFWNYGAIVHQSERKNPERTRP